MKDDSVPPAAEQAPPSPPPESDLHRLAAAFEQSADAVMLTDRDGCIVYVNAGFERLTGYRRAEVLGKRHALASGHQAGHLNRRLWQTIATGRPFRGVFVNRRKDGTLFREERTISPVLDAAGDVTHFLATGRDVSDQLRMRERLQFMTRHDSLTRLPNRGTFLAYLETVLATARRRDSEVAVLILNVDRFKLINDGLGHDTGDRLLGALAARLRSCVSEKDTVARLGGDEFAVLVEDFHSEHEIEELARQMMRKLSRPFRLQGREIFVTTCVGISLYPRDGDDDPTSLLRNAARAMNGAKTDGRNTYQFYSAEMGAGALQRLDLESALRRALERDEFELFYQPQIDLSNRQMCAVEALIRWRHPTLGLLTPADFMTLLEETGLIIPVGVWTIRTGLEQQLAWRRQGLPEVRMAINLSARQLGEPGFADLVGRMLDELEGPVNLEFEITESVLMQSTSRTAAELRVLSERGIRIALDDFGTGYSSLAHIKQLPVDALKIDRLFMRDVTTSPDDAAIVRAILALSKSLDLLVIAEGVETEEHLQFLLDAGCPIGQGYFFGRPMEGDKLGQILAAG